MINDTLVLSNQALNELRFQVSQRYNNIDTIGYSPDGTPQGSLKSSVFGQSTALSSGAAPRRVELGFRLNF